MLDFFLNILFLKKKLSETIERNQFEIQRAEELTRQLELNKRFNDEKFLELKNDYENKLKSNKFESIIQNNKNQIEEESLITPLKINEINDINEGVELNLSNSFEESPLISSLNFTLFFKIFS